MDYDDKTRIIRRSGNDMTEQVPAGGGQGYPGTPPPYYGGSDFSADATRIVDLNTQPKPAGGGGSAPVDENKTVIFRPSARRPAGGEAASAGAAPVPSGKKAVEIEPVVGWMGVVRGPGTGGFVRLGYGLNSIGRGDDQRCQINFGDEQISRQNHASISYDSRSRKFFFVHGGGTNLSYIGETPVLQPTELVGGEYITIGNTLLRFVPFCGPNFDYSDVPME